MQKRESEEPELPARGDLTWPGADYLPGTDELWDRLGGELRWDALDGIAPGMRVYVEFGAREDTRLVVTGLVIKGSVEHPLMADTLRAVPLGRLEARRNELNAVTYGRKPGKALQRPDGQDPNGFYQLVADHYRFHVLQSSKPAARIAEEADVPVTTVHRWIREARLRGFLPPGRRGKAG